MFNQLQSHLQWRADLLLQGRYEDLAHTYILPQVVYSGEDIFHLTDLDAAVLFLQDAHKDLIARGIRRCHLRVIAVGLPVRGRFKVWASLTFIAAAGDILTDAVFYMVETAKGLRSEMMEFSDCAQSQSNSRRHATSVPV